MKGGIVGGGGGGSEEPPPQPAASNARPQTSASQTGDRSDFNECRDCTSLVGLLPCPRREILYPSRPLPSIRNPRSLARASIKNLQKLEETLVRAQVAEAADVGDREDEPVFILAAQRPQAQPPEGEGHA